MDSGGIPEGWEPLPPPEIGSPRWKDDVAFQVVLRIGALSCEENTLVDCGSYNGTDLGFMAIQRSSAGWNYFRIDRKAVR